MSDDMQKVASLKALPVERGLRVDIGGKKILLVRDGEAVRAYSAVCPHAEGPLEEGAICNGRIVCPWHKGTFLISDGALVEPPALDGLARYPVCVEGDDIFVSPNEIAKTQSQAPRDARSFVIVGAGAAGGTAAAALREFGFGGRIVLVGRELGLPFDRTSLSKFVVAGQMKPNEVPLLRPEKFYHEQRIERVQADVQWLDAARREIVLADDATLAFDAALIATGGTPTPLDVPGADLPGVHLLRSREDAGGILAEVRRGARVVMLGGSFIGLEVASSLREQEVHVSVVSPETTPFARQFGERIGRMFRALHEEHGVAFHAGRQAARIEGARRATSVALNDGGRLPADFVVIGVGVRPATEFVAGVKREEDGGLPVDASMRVADNLYAAGDIAAFSAFGGKRRRIEHWRVAQQQARVAARNMVGGDAVFSGPPFFWTYHYGQNFEYLGYAESWDEEIVTGDLEGRNFVALLLRDRDVAAVVACGHERATAALAERMREPLSATEALKIIKST